MKGLYASCLLLLCSVVLLSAQTESRPASMQRELTHQSIHTIGVRYLFPEHTIHTTRAGDGQYSYVHVTGTGKLREPGLPALPALTELFAVPYLSTATVMWTGSYTETTVQHRIHPALEPAFDTYGAPDPPFILDTNLYNTDAFFPEHPAMLLEQGVIRGLEIKGLRLSPVQYNPVSGVLRIYQTLEVTIQFEGSGASFEHLAQQSSSSYTRFLANLLLNGASLPEGQHSAANDPVDYLIVTIDAFKDAADTLARWRRQMGHRPVVISKPSWTWQQVRDSVHQRYQNTVPRPDFLLILGDHQHVPAQTFTSGSTFYPTDLYFVCMDGSADFFPDMAKGRISVSGASQAMAVAQKVIHYERSPQNDSSFYQNALHCAQFQDDDTTGYASRRFTHTSEEVRDFVMTQGKNIQRIYYTYPYVNPTNYNNGFYSNGEPLPADLLRSNGFLWNGGATEIAQSINAGKFYVLHRDHGYVGGSGWAHPYFTTTSMNNLTNGTKTPVVFSINCHTGEFSLNECFAEKFLRLSAGGAAGVFAASFASYSGYNDALTAGFFDAIWSNPGLVPVFGSGGVANPSLQNHPPILHLGHVLNHGLLRMVQTWNGSTTANTYQHRLLHFFGDPAMKMFTEVPAVITAQIPDTVMVGTTHLAITGCNTPDALVTLLYQNELTAQATIQNSQAALNSWVPLNDTTLRATITISKHNHQPLIREVVIANAIPAINDDPCQSIPLVVKRYCDPVTSGFAGAATSAVNAPSCAGLQGHDVWFNAVTPLSGRVEVEAGEVTGSLGLAIYSGSCQAPLHLQCDTTISNSNRITLQLQNLTPGDTLLIRVWQNGSGAPSTFTICVKEPDTFPYANLPYYTGFEQGIDPYWELVSSNAAGRIRIDSVCDARYGNASLLMDQSVNGTYAQNEARLRLNLRDQKEVSLSFWWREYGDEHNEQDGVFFSDDGGENYVKVIELKGSFEAWTQYLVDVDELAGLNGLKLTESFVIKFQQYDNWGMICNNPTGGDGFAFDEIRVFMDTAAPGVATLPYYTGFESGIDSCWTIRSSHPLGRIVATGAYGPFAGGYHLLMDVSTGSNYNRNTADLRVDLSGKTNTVLTFRWKSIGNESFAENGVWLSDNGGATFALAMPLNDTNTYWALKNLNLDQACQTLGLTPGNSFVVRFQQYDNHPATSDGFGFDEVNLYPALAPIADLHPIALGFASDTGKVQTKPFYIINRGTDTLRIDSMFVPSNFSAAFTAPSIIQPGDSMTVQLSFNPDSVSVYSGTLRYFHNASSGLDSIRLEGLGMYRELIPSIFSLDFDTMLIFSTDTIEFQLTNPGNGTVAMSAVTAPAGCTVLTPQSQNFSPGQTRTVRIQFKPTVKGAYSGQLLITTDANNLSLPVTGYVFDPTGMDEPSLAEYYLIYPNPVRDLLHINSKHPEQFTATISDMSGRELIALAASLQLMIDVSWLAPGTYLLTLRQQEGVFQTRIIRH